MRRLVSTRVFPKSQSSRLNAGETPKLKSTICPSMVHPRWRLHRISCLPEAPTERYQTSGARSMGVPSGSRNVRGATLQVARTSMNIASSRSHSVFTLSMRVKKEGSDEVLSAKLNLVDLAGSERVWYCSCIALASALL